MSKGRGGPEILISTRVRAEIGEGYTLEPAGSLQLKGFHQAYEAYRLLDNGHRAAAFTA